MTRPYGVLALVAFVLAALFFLVAAASIDIGTLSDTRKVAWGLFCLMVGLVFGTGGYYYGGRVA